MAALGVGEVDLRGVDRQPDQRSEALEQRRDRRSQLIRRRGNGDTDDVRFRSRQSQPGEDTGLGPAGRRRQDDDRRRDARRLCLPSDLDPREHLARRTGRSGPADPDHERAPSRSSQIRGNALDEGLAIGADISRGDVDRGAEQRVQDFVRPRWRGWRSGQDEVNREARLGAGRGRQTAMVRPAAPGRDQRVGALGERLADEEFEVAQLVAAERERQQVFALDPDIDGPAERGRETRQPLERRRAVDQREARQGGDAGGSVNRTSPADGSRRRRSVIRPLPSADGDEGDTERALDIDRPEQRHGAVDRGVGRDRRFRRALLVCRDDGAGRQDPDPPPR